MFSQMIYYVESKGPHYFLLLVNFKLLHLLKLKILMHDFWSLSLHRKKMVDIAMLPISFIIEVLHQAILWRHERNNLLFPYFFYFRILTLYQYKVTMKVLLFTYKKPLKCIPFLNPKYLVYTHNISLWYTAWRNTFKVLTFQMPTFPLLFEGKNTFQNTYILLSFPMYKYFQIP